jgi:hypothetical protein
MAFYGKLKKAELRTPPRYRNGSIVLPSSPKFLGMQLPINNPIA